MHKEILTQSQRKSILSTKMFLKAKFKPSGAYDNLKSQLVAGGLYRDKSSSPTASTSYVFTITTIAQSSSNRRLSRYILKFMS